MLFVNAAQQNLGFVDLVGEVVLGIDTGWTLNSLTLESKISLVIKKKILTLFFIYFL